MTSSGDNWSGENITKVRDRFSQVRAHVQNKGTKAAKRLLKRLSGAELRYQIRVKHNISKQIIFRAIETQSIVAIVDLTGIRDRTNTQPRNKTERSGATPRGAKDAFARANATHVGNAHASRDGLILGHSIN